MKKKILLALSEKHIKETPPKSIVTNTTVRLCHFTKSVTAFLGLDDNTIYINTRI